MCCVFDMFLLCVVLMCLCGVVALFLLPRHGLLVSAPSVSMSLLADFALGMRHGSFAVARLAVPRPASAMCVSLIWQSGRRILPATRRVLSCFRTQPMAMSHAVCCVLNVCSCCVLM